MFAPRFGLAGLFGCFHRVAQTPVRGLRPTVGSAPGDTLSLRQGDTSYCSHRQAPGYPLKPIISRFGYANALWVLQVRLCCPVTSIVPAFGPQWWLSVDSQLYCNDEIDAVDDEREAVGCFARSVGLEV